MAIRAARNTPSGFVPCGRLSLEQDRRMNLTPMDRKGLELDVDKLLACARQRSGLSDFGDPYFLDPLRELIGCANRDGGVPSEDCLAVQTVISYLVDRLRLTDYVKRHPKIRDEVVQVAGLIHLHARGGSTLLHRILSQSPQLTATSIWEMVAPVPLPNEKIGEPTERLAQTQAWLKVFEDDMPGYKTMHPMSPYDIEEESLLMDRSFVSGMWQCHFYAPTYLFWMRQYDHTKVYEELRLWLQLMQYQTPGRGKRKWILKASTHALGGNLRIAMRTFPDAKIIMTHRRMEDTLVSLCSVRNQHLGLSSTTYDPKALGEQLISYYVPAIRDIIEIMKEGPADRFINVYYRDTNADPLKVFESVMKQMGIAVTDADMDSAKMWLARNGRESFPKHDYKAEDYGFSRKRLAEAFKFYHDAFDI
jgi:hypothetical protein